MDALLPVPPDYDLFHAFDLVAESDMMRNRSSSSLSSVSIESNASTVEELTMNQSLTFGDDLVLDAYCLVNGWMVRIRYPDPAQGWVF
eukprot:5335668-Prymnesium_polylepis.1